MNRLRGVSLVSLLIFTVACTSYRQVTEPTGSRLETHINFLASDELQGRYPGTEGDIMARRYVEEYLNLIGLETRRQDFTFVKAVKAGELNSLLINGKPAPKENFTPFAFSSDTLIKAPLVFAGYGITVKADSFEWDDYKGSDVKGKWIMALRNYPHIEGGDDYFPLSSDDRDKAMLAADNGAAGLLLVSGYHFDVDDKLTEVNRKVGSVGIPVFQISRSLADSILSSVNENIKQIETEISSLKKTVLLNTGTTIEGRSDLVDITGTTANIFGILKSSDPRFNNEYIIVGAHLDHLGKGGPGSSTRLQDTVAVHNGADDNASGVSVMLELAARLKEKELRRSFIFAAFGGEEMGLLGSKYFVNHMPVDSSKIVSMINLDMVGRLDTAKGIQIGGTGTSVEADSLIRISNTGNLKLRLSREGSGPSDHSSFYGKNIPVYFITTGAHTDYHTPDDDVERINLDGLESVMEFTGNLLASVDALRQKPVFMEAGPKETPGPGYRFKVTLGFMPDFSSTDIEGVRVDFVTKGKAAERGGIKNGDIITAINGLQIKNIYDYMYRLGKLSKNQIISVEILRNGIKEVLLIQL